jgi:hypothetical protein
MVSSDRRLNIAAGRAAVARSNGPLPGVRLTAIDSGQPFPGSVAEISGRSLFLLAPRTSERARQVPLHLPFGTSRRTKISLASAKRVNASARKTLLCRVARLGHPKMPQRPKLNNSWWALGWVRTAQSPGDYPSARQRKGSPAGYNYRTALPGISVGRRCGTEAPRPSVRAAFSGITYRCERGPARCPTIVKSKNSFVTRWQECQPRSNPGFRAQNERHRQIEMGRACHKAFSWARRRKQR